MVKKILITGGAGFIGSHLADALLERGHDVRIFDNLDPQIHPEGKPDYLNPAAEFVHGDVRDREAFKAALDGVDAVYHFAAAVGTGQSMYQIEKYAAVNVGGLSNLLDILVETGQRPHVIFPGSATSYGEAAHRCPEHGPQEPELRPIKQLEQHDWEVHCPVCQRPMQVMPTPETYPLRPKFVYGLNKKTCEELLQTVAETYEIPYTILRFFNVYGPRQSLSNPYTGVIAVFSSRIKNGNPPLVIEDGQESRDFISVYDVVQANLLSLDKPAARSQVMNVGTGSAVNILNLAGILVELLGGKAGPEVNGEFRKGDFRHNLADISKIRTLLGFEPKIDFRSGMEELVGWSKTQTAQDDFSKAYQELEQHGLVGGKAKPMVGVVTLNWNGFAMTVECVEALLQSSYSNLKIFVVDNGSKDREAERLRQRFGDRVSVIESEKNLGVAGGNNLGLKAAMAIPGMDYVVMMNNDLIVEPDTIARLVAPAQADPKVGMVASRMMNYFEREKVDNLGIALTTAGLGYNRKTEWHPLYCPCSGLGLYRVAGLREIAIADGEVWDDDFFAYFDEQDVGFRLRMRGYTAAYAPDAVGYHKDGASSGGPTSDFAIFQGHRNNLWFVVKDFPTGLWLKYWPGILATQFGTFVLYLKRRRLGVIVRAKLASLKGLPRMFRKRKQIQKLRTVPLKELERHLIRQAYITPERSK